MIKMVKKTGRYHFAIYPRLSKRLRNPTKENTQLINRGLVTLCDMLKGADFNWFLVGGIGLDIHAGEMRRFHHDIDIEIPSEQKVEMLNYMARIGYSLFTKVLVANLPRNMRLAIYQESDVSKCAPEAKSRFRLVKSSDDRLIEREPWPLQYIDVSFTRKLDSGIEVGYRGRTIVFPVSYSENNMAVNFQGQIIRLRHPLYQAWLKRGSKSDIDVFDMNNLRNKLTEEQLSLLA